jgi:ABC-type multidrug transport system ATPase subunit
MPRLAVRLRAVTVLLGRFPALARVDFDAFEGEVVFIRGPNGSGKTTLLRLIAGLVEAFDGSVAVFGRDPRSEARAIRREVSFLSHATLLYEDLTARENLAFFAGSGGFRLEAGLDWAERLGLGARELDTRLRALSAGQRKKVSAAVAFARDTELVLVDEPHALLDTDTKAALDRGLVALAGEGKTVIVASHELDRAATIATRRYSMTSGSLRPEP